MTDDEILTLPDLEGIQLESLWDFNDEDSAAVALGIAE